MQLYVGIIPFRRNSKRVTNKNIFPINGEPLFKYSIVEAMAANSLDIVIVATDYNYSEIEKYMQYDTGKLCYLNRSPVPDNELAAQYILYVIKSYRLREEDNIVLLQPTCPIRNSEWIDEAINMHKKEPHKNVLSAYKVDNGVYNKNGVYLDLLGLPVYVRNSSIYIFNVGVFINSEYNIFKGEVNIYEMPKWASVDINTYDDLEDVKIILERKKVLK